MKLTTMFLASLLIGPVLLAQSQYTYPPNSGSGGGGGGQYSSPSAAYGIGTVYFTPGGGQPANATESAVQTPAPVAGSYGNLVAKLTAAPGGSNTIVFTFRKAGVDTTSTCTITGAATSCSDTHTFVVATGDLLDISGVVTGGTITAGVTLVWSLPGVPGATGATGQTGPGYLATSTTSLATGTGSKTFTTQSGLAYATGSVTMAISAGTGEYMFGTVTSYSGTTLVLNSTVASGTGTHSDWNLSVSGLAGPQGATGATGATGAAGTNGTNGTNGNTLLNGAGVPSNGSGADGDYYLRTSNTCLYGPKAAGAWPGSCQSLIGPTGATGATGAAGANGAISQIQNSGTNLTVRPTLNFTAGGCSDNSGANRTDCTGGAGGGSVFTGSTASNSTGIGGTASAPTFSCVDQSVKSPVRYEFTLSANVTSVGFVSCGPGAKFDIAWTQAASGGPYSVTYGGSTTGTCTVSQTASAVTIQLLEVNSGSTIVGTGCVSTDVMSAYPEVNTSLIAGIAGVDLIAGDSTNHALMHNYNNGGWVVFGTGSGGGGGVNPQTTSYTLVSGDSGKVVTMNCSSCSAHLPSTAPSATWAVDIKNLNASDLTVDVSGLTIKLGSNTTVTSFPLKGGQDSACFSDGTNYVCSAPQLAGSGITFTPTTGGLTVSIGNGAITPAMLAPADFTTPGTSKTFSLNAGYFECTSTCTITMPVPVAGQQFCVRNANNISTVITFAAIGSSARYENTASTAYGTAGTGTLVSGGAVGDRMCLVGKDSTHYDVWSFVGTWIAN